MSKITPFRRAQFPKTCCGCGEPFPVRAGNAEALVGWDGRLYCHDGPRECLERALGTIGCKAA